MKCLDFKIPGKQIFRYFARRLLIANGLVTTARKTKGSSNPEMSSRNAIYSYEFC